MKSFNINHALYLYINNESTNWTHLGLYFNGNNILKCLFHLNIWYKLLSFKCFKFEGKHRHYVTKRDKKAKKNKEMEAWGPRSSLCVFSKRSTLPFVPIMRSPARKDQIGWRKEKSACRRVAPRSSTILPNIPKARRY